MGILVTVYRAADRSDCSNNGATARHSSLTITNVDGPFEPSADAPAARLVAGNVPGTCKIVPDEIPAGTWSMFGGNYAGTSDSRFCSAVRDFGGNPSGIAPVHDRVETRHEQRMSD